MLELRVKRIVDVQRMYTGDAVLHIVAEKAPNSSLDKLYAVKGAGIYIKVAETVEKTLS